MSDRPRRLVAATAVLGIVSAGCSGAQVVDPSLDDLAMAATSLDGWTAVDDERELPDREGLQELLDQVAVAFRTGDRDAIAEVLSEPESVFGQRWLNRAEWMTGLPIAHYELDLDETFADMASDALHESTPGVQVVYVEEQLAIEGFDDPERPSREDLFLTVVDTDEGWRIAGDRDAERLGFVSVDHLWDLGPVTTTRRGNVGAIHHPSMDVEQLLGEAERALATAQARWPEPFPPIVPILVPRTEDELGQLLHVSFDLSNFVAFATATSFSEKTTYELAGSRIVINPDRFLRRDTRTRELILVHEFVHIATHQVAGLTTPSWVDEGVAQAIGEERSATGTRLLDALVAEGFEGVPPTDTQFRIGGRDRVFLSYQQAWSFLDHLVRVYGADVIADFYAELGVGSVGLPGSEDFHVDRAAREVFGRPIAELAADWAAALRS